MSTVLAWVLTFQYSGVRSGIRVLGLGHCYVQQLGQVFEKACFSSEFFEKLEEEGLFVYFFFIGKQLFFFFTLTRGRPFLL